MRGSDSVGQGWQAEAGQFSRPPKPKWIRLCIRLQEKPCSEKENLHMQLQPSVDTLLYNRLSD